MLILGAHRSARAQEAVDDEDAIREAARDGEDEADEAPPWRRGLEWPEQYARAHWAEAVAGPVIVAGGFTMLFAGPVPDTDRRAITAFDRKLQPHLGADNERTRRALNVIGDVGYLGSFAYRAFDDLIIAGAIRNGWDVAWQLLVIDVLAFGLVGATTFGSQLLFGRMRPKYALCEEEMGVGNPECEGGTRTNRSFISGHHAVSVAGASLTCLHHSRLRIYRTKRAGRAACASHALMAVLVAVARVADDSHWPTDILLGSALGFAAGWVLPRALHYGFREAGHGHGQWDDDESSRDSAPGFRMAVMPNVGPGRVGLGAFGLW